MVLCFQVTHTITMGKMKRGRQKAHSAAIKLKNKSNDQSVEVVDMEQDTKTDQVSSPLNFKDSEMRFYLEMHVF